jgi:PKD repeat protein
MFLPDGTLLVATGEGAPDINVNTQALRAQNLDSLGGKILRVNRDGTAPATNPFFTGEPTANRSKVWAYGLRNPFRFTMRPANGALYIGDVGWGSWEEVNVAHGGENFGWPCFEGEEFLLGYSAYQVCQDLNAANIVTEPLYYYPHPPSSAVVGGAFYEGTEYPSQYQGAFFFGDYSRNSISTLRTNGLDALVPGSVLPLTNAADGPVQIFTGPDGNIYYLSINTGQLRRIRYVAGNRAPVPHASATPAAGLLPLQVQFSSAGTFDPEGHPIAYHWDFGDGATSDEANPQHTFTTAGAYDVELTAQDALGASALATVHVVAGNAPPVAAITTPAPSTQYGVGDTITFSGGATDTEDGTLGGAALSWSIILHHCETITMTCHQHPFLGAAGPSGSFVVPDHGGGVSFELFLTATDSAGLSDTKSVVINPRLVPLTIESSPPGLTVAVDGLPRTLPATVNVVEDSEHTLYAPSPQTAGGATLNYLDWSDGGLQNHPVTAAGATTVRVRYRDADGDTDNDGCADTSELGSNATTGGRRDPYSFWDFFDTPNGANVRDHAITVGDLMAVVARFGAHGSPGLDPLSAPAPAPGYHTAFDRAAPPSGGDPWDAAAADGVVSTTDIVLAVAQFGHTCT